MLIEPKPLNNGVKKHDRNIYLRRTFFLALLSFSLSRATRILKMQIINSGLQKGREGQGLLFRGKCLVCKERADSPPCCLKSSKIPGRCCTRAIALLSLPCIQIAHFDCQQCIFSSSRREKTRDKESPRNAIHPIWQIRNLGGFTICFREQIVREFFFREINWHTPRLSNRDFRLGNFPVSLFLFFFPRWEILVKTAGQLVRSQRGPFRSEEQDDKLGTSANFGRRSLSRFGARKRSRQTENERRKNASKNVEEAVRRNNA